MRARYYSPDMKRFINADIVAGAISNAITLNRFAYANGNPVSFIDPFGLRAVSMASHAMTRVGGDRANHTTNHTTNNTFDIKYNSFMTLVNCLFDFSVGQDFTEFQIDVGNLTFYQSYELSIGEGNIAIDKLIDNQIEISKQFDFSQGTFKFTTGNDILLGVEYSANVDEYNSISASATFYNNSQLSGEIKIVTNYPEGFSLETIIGARTNNNSSCLSNPKNSAYGFSFIPKPILAPPKKQASNKTSVVGKTLFIWGTLINNDIKEKKQNINNNLGEFLDYFYYILGNNNTDDSNTSIFPFYMPFCPYIPIIP